MANAEQLEILKQGVEGWNKWRGRNRGVTVDLSEADLSETNLCGALLGFANLGGSNLQRTNLSQANLGQTNLNAADLSDADLRMAYLSGADLTASNLTGANLWQANISGDLCPANLSHADFRHANLSEADLSMADLSEAVFIGTNFSRTILNGSNFWRATVGGTIFGASDFSEAIGLEEIYHSGPSRISTDAFIDSKGRIPQLFLQGCGLSDWEIETVKLYNPDLSNHQVNEILYKIYDLRAEQALQISPLFISYSHADSTFVDKLEHHLQRQGIRFWRDVHAATAGRLEKIIDRAIRQNPTVLLILSTKSIKSDWVEHEVRTARNLEQEMGRDVLCPVALDISWKSSPWPKRVMEQVMEYNILDFSDWKDDIKFENMFRKLIDGLELFYKAYAKHNSIFFFVENGGDVFYRANENADTILSLACLPISAQSHF